MERITLSQVTKELHNKEVYVAGFVQEVKVLSKVEFIVLRDSTGKLQVTVVKSMVPEEVFKSISKISPESVVGITGTVNSQTEAKSGIEVLLKEIKVLSIAAPELPIPVVEHDINTSFNKKLDFRSVDLRKPENQAVFKIEAALLEGLQAEAVKEGFIQVFTPCIMGVPSESGAEAFKIDYYGSEACLRQDPQLHRQLTIAGGFERIFDLGPSWRAEKSHTTKHICEHRVIAAEMAYLTDEQDVMRLQERLIVAALKNVKEKCKEELKILGVEISIPKTPFPELRFPEIYEILERKGKHLEFGEDLDAEANQLMWEHVKERYNAEFYFFNRFPFKIKPFYVMAVDEEPKYARSVDLNFRGFELSSGGQREHRFEKIVEHVREKGMDYESVEWFAKFFQWGCPPHGGFAIGIERLTQALLNLENIRQTVLFPRDPTRRLP